jgi:hypothetical protein
VRSLLARRLEADAALGARLVAAGAATTAFVVPLLGLFLLVQDRWPPLLRLDEGAAQVLNRVAVSNPALVVALRAVSVVLDPWTFRLGAVVVVVVLARRRRDRLAVWVAVTVGGSGVVGLAAKHLFGRERRSSTHRSRPHPGCRSPRGTPSARPSGSEWSCSSSCPGSRPGGGSPPSLPAGSASWPWGPAGWDSASTT